MGESQDKEIIAELCGAIIGDGWIQSDERCFFIAGDPTEDKDYYDKYLIKIFDRVGIKTTPKEFPYWKVYGIGIYKKEIIQKLLSWKIPKGKKVHTAKIPEWIFNSKKKIVYAFLRGFFDADGSVFCQKDYTKYANDFNSKYHCKIRIRMSSVSIELIKQIQKLCDKFGIKCVVRTIKRGHIVERNCQDVNIIEINSIEHVNQWFNEVKPSNGKHTTKYLIWKKHGFCPPYTTIKQRKDILKNKLNPYTLY